MKNHIATEIEVGFMQVFLLNICCIDEHDTSSNRIWIDENKALLK